MSIEHIRAIWESIPAHLRHRLALVWQDAACAGEVESFIDSWGLEDL